MSSIGNDWRILLREGIMSYRDALSSGEIARDYHNRRNGLYGEDYVRPGLSVEIPLFWGTF